MQDLLVVEQIQRIRKDLPRIGTRKLHFMLQDFLLEHQLKLGRDKLYELLRAHQILYRRSRSRMKTTQSHHRYFTYPNLIKDYELIGAHQLWVSDITYIPVGTNFCYLSLVTDAYSRMIVGWSLQPDLQAKGVVEALKMALQQLPPGQANLIHHSDRGIQYCCRDYLLLLKSSNIQVSMTQTGDPSENALAERVNGILKEEILLNRRFFSYEEALAMVEKAMYLYNHIRPHSSCDYLTPYQAHSQKGQLIKRWKAKMPNDEKIAVIETGLDQYLFQ